MEMLSSQPVQHFLTVTMMIIHRQKGDAEKAIADLKSGAIHAFDGPIRNQAGEDPIVVQTVTSEHQHRILCWNLLQVVAELCHALVLEYASHALPGRQAPQPDRGLVQ